MDPSTRKLYDKVCAFKAFAELAKQMHELRQDPIKWGDELEKQAAESITKFGYYRLHPSVGAQFDADRAIHLLLHNEKYLLKTGEPYYLSSPKRKQGQVVAEFGGLREAIDSIYNLSV